MTRRSASRGILYTAPPTGTESESQATADEADATDATEAAAADD